MKGLYEYIYHNSMTINYSYISFVKKSLRTIHFLNTRLVDD